MNTPHNWRPLFCHFFLALTLAAPLARANEPLKPIGEWVFVPEYMLPGRAANHPGPRVQHPRSKHPLVVVESAPMLFRGDPPTGRLTNLLGGEDLPRDQFTIEAWLCHHVNQPVGMVIAVKGKTPASAVPWSLGFHNWETTMTLANQNGQQVQLHNTMKKWGGYKQRWVHLVATYNSAGARLFVNGQQVGQAKVIRNALDWPARPELELGAYMKNEPHMQWANLVHVVRMYDRALPPETVQQNFKSLQTLVESGKLYPRLFHYTAGPYLNYATTSSVNVVWETDRPASAVISWGPTAELGHRIELAKPARLQEATLDNLDPSTPYFYRVDSVSADDPAQQIDTGLLTFKTAVAAGQPLRFAVIGDTESRPHINDQLCKLIWNERPNFLINLGDLTDGGHKPHRYEWTHEYFVGMNQLISRVPVFAVPGNGEGDLFWYKHYHRYPDPEGFYKFRFGDAAFFMLDSNQRETEFAPGGKQYEWLEKQLQDCDAKWKFACHHHATYTGEEDDYGDTWKGATSFGDPAVQQIVPLYEKYGIDIVMFGHLHLYERSLPMRSGKVDFKAGTIHLLAGGGGGNLEDFAPTPAFFSAKTHRGHHYLTIDLHGEALTMRMFDLDGAMRDTLTLEKHASGQLKHVRQQANNR